jgi:hypothetical protein
VPNMLQPTGNIAPQVANGLSQARPSSMQQQQANPVKGPAELASPQVSNPQPMMPPSPILGMPNSRMMADPMMLQQILSTMLLQPQGGIGQMMQPTGAVPSATPLTPGPMANSAPIKGMV